MGSPRFLIYVNRELVDQETGVKLSARSEETETVRGHVGPKTSTGASGAGNATNATSAIVAGDLKKALSDPRRFRWCVGPWKRPPARTLIASRTGNQPSLRTNKPSAMWSSCLVAVAHGRATLVDQRVAH